MRIALIPSAYAPAVGGVEELSRRLADHLSSSGHEVEIWTHLHPANLPPVETIDGVVVRRFEMPLPTARVEALLRLGPAATRSLHRMMRATRALSPDVFHVQCFSGNGIYSSALSLLFQKPLVISLQGETLMDDSDIYTHSTSLRLGLRGGLRIAAAVTGCSQFTLDDAIRRFGLPGSAGTVVPNGVDVADMGEIVPLELPFRRFVLALGRVVDKKGFDLLIEAFQLLARDCTDIGLVIGGDGPARSGLLARVRELGLADRAVLPGSLSREQVRWVMRNAAVFVLPSRLEPFGIVVLEAMNAGTPVVVSAHGGATEIIRDGVDGIVVDPFDTRALETALRRLIDNPQERGRLAQAARIRVREYDWQKITDQYLSLYSRAIRHSNRRHSRSGA